MAELDKNLRWAEPVGPDPARTAQRYATSGVLVSAPVSLEVHLTLPGPHRNPAPEARWLEALLHGD